MARGIKTISQRIQLEGADKIAAELKKLGITGEEVFRKLQESADKLQGPSNQFVLRLQRLQGQMQRVGASFRDVGRDITFAGLSVTRRVTVPLVGAGSAVVKFAGDFESAMNRVRAALQPTGTEFEQLRAQAREIGPAFGFSVSEAAAGIEILAKNGLDASQILGGALSASLKLAAGQEVDLSEAGDAATDVMLSFGHTAADLGADVDRITGTLIQSKFGFQDYAQALGQAGGAVSGLGVDFDDFNAVIAVTSNRFNSGSDAGTSFKTFVQRLSPVSKKAADEIQRLGLRFFDAEGQMRPMAEIAEELKTKLSGLSQEDLNLSLSTVFGTDAIRTAIGLMNAGADGVERMDAAIKKASAAEQVEAKLKGFNGQLRQMAAALSDLAVEIGDSGLLQDATELVKQLVGLIKQLRDADPAMVRLGLATAALLAVVGPLVAAIGFLVSGIGALVSAGGAVLGWIAGLIVGVGQLGGLFAGLGTALEAVGAAITAVVAGIAAALGLPVAAVVAIIAAIVAAGVALFVFWDEVKAGAQAAYDYIVNLFSPESLAAAWGAIAAGAASAWAAIVAGAEAAFGGIIDSGAAAWGAIVAGAEALWTGIAAAFTAGLALIEPLWSALEAGAQAGFESILVGANILFEGIGAGLSALADLIAPAWQAIADAAGGTFTGIAADASAAWDNISSGAQGVFDAIAGVFKTGRDTIAAIWQSVTGLISQIWETATGNIRNAAQAVTDALTQATNLAADTDAAAAVVAGIVRPFEEARDTIAAIWEGIQALATDGMAAISAGITVMANQMVSALNAVIAALRRAEAQARETAAAVRSASAGGRGSGFAAGGRVRGPGTSTSDSIPALLSDGEFVIRAAAVRKYGATLFASLNAMALPPLAVPRLAGGGPVVADMMPRLSDLLVGMFTPHLAPVPRFANGGQVPQAAASGGRPLELVIGGERFPVTAPQQVAERLARFAVGSQMRSAGRKPSWMR